MFAAGGEPMGADIPRCGAADVPILASVLGKRAPSLQVAWPVEEAGVVERPAIRRLPRHRSGRID